MKETLLLIALTMVTQLLFGENLTVSNVSLINKNTDTKEISVQFDIAWDKSWKNDTNHDAAWIFIKHRTTNNSSWRHTYGFHGSTSNNYLVHTVQDSVGVFLSRNLNGEGIFQANGIRLTWNYADHGLSDQDEIEIYVGAMEMVYVAQGSFYIGDGVSTASFRTVGANTPYQIVGENAITLGGSNESNLTVGYFEWDDDPDFFTSEQTLPLSYPKGFEAFYCMKYEISQGLVTDFLNRITADQVNFHTVGAYINEEQGNPVRNGQSRNTIGGEYPNFACATPHRPSGFIKHPLFLAMADWTGLRPMSEMEWEKANRGPNQSVAGEYAWGNTSFSLPTGIANDGLLTETSTNDEANANCTVNTGLDGPLRSGWQAGTSRAETGATYWGIRDMTGNVWERAITINSPMGRAFNGAQGDGEIDAGGNADVSGWPDIYSYPHNIGHRGGSYNLYPKGISERDFSTGSSGALPNYGGRFVRSNATVTGQLPTSYFENRVNPNPIIAYPNPTADFVFFSENGNGKDYQIYNGTGKLILSGQVEENRISVKDLPLGIYFLHLKMKNTVEVIKIVVNK